MKVLALELSSARGSLAWRDGQVDLERDWPNDRQNSSAFFQNLAQIRKEFGLPEIIIVGLGPGSYAGTRIAISAAIGLSFGGTTSVSSKNDGHDNACPSIELIGYPSICALDSVDYCVIGDARRSSFFFALVCANNLVEGPDLFTESELRARLESVDNKMSIFASEKLSQFDNVKVRYPSAKLLAELALDSNRGFTQPPLEPIYLREPHITIPRK
jgi:tRNA A37 threonylcarbamoyladenosine modification protein TsaB